MRSNCQKHHARSNISEDKLFELFSPIYLIDEGWSDPDATMFEGIRSVPYGSYVDCEKDAEPRAVQYWRPPERLRREWRTPMDCIAHFRNLFSQVIKEHLDTPSSIAAELSGGIDSGCNVCIAGDMLLQQGRRLHAYTATFGTQSPEERKRVHAIYRRYPNVIGHMLDCSDDIHLLEQSDLNEYRTTAHPSRQNLPATFVSLARRAHADGARVLLSGEGADWYLEGTDMIWDSLIKSVRLCELMRTLNVLRTRSNLRKALRYVLQSALPALLPGRLGRKAYLHEYYESTIGSNLPDIFTPGFCKNLTDMLRWQQDKLLKRGNLSCWSQTLEHELMFPPNHVWQGVPIETEICLPYLDRRVVEFGLTVPPEYKFRIDEQNTSHYGCRKHLQREGFRHVVPEEVINSQKKETYGSPVNRRLANELPALTESDMLLCEMGVIDRRKLADAAKCFLDDSDNDTNSLVPWLDTILCVEKWLIATTEEFPDCRLPTFRL